MTLQPIPGWIGGALALALGLTISGIGLSYAEGKAPFCETVAEILAQSEVDEFSPDGLPENLPGSPACGTAKALGGGTSVYCNWVFPYRDDRARAAFDLYEGMLTNCFSPTQAGPAQSDVNHPDSYVQQEYEHGGMVISLSLKDKIALDQSLIFLRLNPTPAPAPAQD